LIVQVSYEKATYKAILLGNASRKSSTNGFTAFPLVLIKMPVALRQLFLNYLANTFDSRVIAMKLRPNLLSSILEKILEPPTEATRFSRGLQLSLAFPSVAPNLKSIDISLAPDDLDCFMKHDVTSQRTKKGPVTGPVTAALAAYLSNTLALDFEHPAVVLDKFVLGPFAFTSEGKVKITESSPEAKAIWIMLLEQAQSTRTLETV
jgi:hypothetical protein